MLYRDANRNATKLSASFVPLIRMAIFIRFYSKYVGWRMDGARRRTISIGAYSIIVFITQRLLWPLTRLGQTFDLYQRAMASTTRVLDLLDTEVGIIEGDLKLSNISGSIVFNDLSFTYPGREVVLDNFQLSIPAGSTVGLVGATGSGKTTLIRLLLRFHELQSGNISIDGHIINDVTLKSLRRSISLVSQNTTLFPGSVRENILYGNPNASEEEILTAKRDR